jgi:hypothetical protein
MLFILIFICLVALLFRLLVNLSLVLIEVSITSHLSLWENFLLVEGITPPDSLPPVSSPKVPSVSTPNLSGIQPSNQPNTSPSAIFKYALYFKNIKSWKFAQFGLGVCVLGVTCYAAAQTQLSVEEMRQSNRKLEEANIIAEEANRLKRIEMATANPQIAPLVFKNYPDEHTAFRSIQNEKAWTDFDNKRDSWANSNWYSRGKPPVPPSDPRP